VPIFAANGEILLKVVRFEPAGEKNAGRFFACIYNLNGIRRAIRGGNPPLYSDCVWLYGIYAGVRCED